MQFDQFGKLKVDLNKKISFADVKLLITLVPELSEQFGVTATWSSMMDFLQWLEKKMLITRKNVDYLINLLKMCDLDYAVVLVETYKRSLLG